jgi:type I restriction enzyme R subunit
MRIDRFHNSWVGSRASVREVVDKWESDEVTADRAYEELVELEEEILSVEDEAEERGLSPSGHALFAALMDDS